MHLCNLLKLSEVCLQLGVPCELLAAGQLSCYVTMECALKVYV